jgi:HSP20 family molecular chaperone IbpA
MSSLTPLHSTLWMPRVDVFEEDDGHMRIEVELPGVPKHVHLTCKQQFAFADRLWLGTM